ncbi:MAG: type II secretion system protein [Planctomycetes bacterium]|nr:type II secretion system protein [Planctomycetota bacterium]
MRRHGFTVVELLVVVAIIGMLMAILLPNLAAALERARQAQCASNLRSIGQSIMIYSSNNRGRWPTVYHNDNAEEAWAERWDEDNTEIEDRQLDVEAEDLNPFRCNVSCWWILIRKGLSVPGVFICPSSDNSEDSDVIAYDRQWSFRDLNNVSYSYQNQLGRTTTDSADPMLVVAADVNPYRADVVGENSSRGEDRRKDRYELNSPNHDFDGQNCLYADNHVAWQQTPFCGIGRNNIWVKSTYSMTDLDNPWEDEEDYGDFDDSVGSRKDTWLVP